jgi:cobalt-zinc-cadmium efflux system membrane fusion protein
MNRFVKPLAIVALLIALIAAGYLSRAMWLPRTQPVESTATTEEAKTTSDKIIVGDLAQKNLKIQAKQLLAGTYWKTITVQGMVVDRPGVSDREIVSPAIGIVSEIHHIPGDIVRPGDVLFTIKLASEALHQTQTDYFKANQDIKLAEAKRKRLAAAGEGIAQARLIEAESEVSRLEVAAKASRDELRHRGFSDADIDGIGDGKLVSEVSITVPARVAGQGPLAGIPPTSGETPLAFEVQQLKVELGEQVQAGQTLCHLSNHQSLAIEGRAFRDETSLLERSIKEGWPVEADFQEDAITDWPALERTFPIRYIANTIDPVTRTFAFLMPLENQSKAIDHDGKPQLLWRFRPGQKVRLNIRVEKLDDVFVVPADAVVFEGAEAFVFTQNVNTFERNGVHVLFRDRDQVVIADDGSLPTYLKGKDRVTIAAVVRVAAAQLNRMSKAGSSSVPKGYHIHADGSLHKNEDEGK